MTNQTSDSTNFDQIHIKNLPKPISTSNCLYPNQDCDNIYFSEYDFRIHVFSSYRKMNWHNWRYYIILSHMKLIQGFTVFYKIKKKKNCFTLQWHESLRWEFLMNIFLLWNASIMNLQKISEFVCQFLKVDNTLEYSTRIKPQKSKSNKLELLKTWRNCIIWTKTRILEQKSKLKLDTKWARSGTIDFGLIALYSKNQPYIQNLCTQICSTLHTII